MTHVTCRLTAKNRDQLRNPTLGNRIWATFTFLRYDTRCYFNVRSKADMSQLNLLNKIKTDKFPAHFRSLHVSLPLTIHGAGMTGCWFLQQHGGGRQDGLQQGGVGGHGTGGHGLPQGGVGGSHGHGVASQQGDGGGLQHADGLQHGVAG